PHLRRLVLVLGFLGHLVLAAVVALFLALLVLALFGPIFRESFAIREVRRRRSRAPLVLFSRSRRLGTVLPLVPPVCLPLFLLLLFFPSPPPVPLSALWADGNAPPPRGLSLLPDGSVTAPAADENRRSGREQ